jgi:Mg-chelatase subunit ChlD/DNA-binding beta-propeller fold protein YncE
MAAAPLAIAVALGVAAAAQAPGMAPERVRDSVPARMLGSTLAPAAALAQGAATPLAYRIADTWRSLDAALPADAWRRATGLAIGASGTVYVVDADEGRLTTIAPDGTVTVLAPSEGGASGLRDAAHLAVDEARDRIYVTDPMAGEVAVFDLAGNRLAGWGGVLEAAGVAVGPEGWVVAGAAETGEIVLFETDGTERLRWRNSTTTQTGGLVRGIDVDDSGRIHVVDGTTSTVRVFNATGRRTSQLSLRIPESIEIRDVAVDEVTRTPRMRLATSIGIYTYAIGRDDYDILPRGDLHAIDVDANGTVATQPATRRNEGSLVLRYDYASTSATSPATIWGRSVALPGYMDQPEVVSLGADGRALVLDRAWRVQAFASDGTVAGQLDPPALKINPVAAAAAPDGTLFVTDGGVLAAHAPDGTEQWQQAIVLGNGDGNAVALAWDEATRLLLVLDSLGDVLHRFTAEGTRQAPIALQAAPDGSTIWGDLDVRGGEAYVLDRINRAVRVVSPQPGGTTWTQRTIQLPARARRFAVAPDGALLTLDRDGWVRRVSPDGNPAGAFDATRFDLAFESAPSDLAADDDGSVLVADRAAGVISRFAPDPGGTPAEPPGEQAQCRSFPDKVADPGTIQLGETVEVRLTVRGGCGSAVSSEPRDVLLVLDRSGSMQGEPIRVLREAALAFLADVDFSTTRVGVISFNETAQRAAPLSANPAPVRAAIRGLQANGQTLLYRALEAARTEFQQRGRPEAAKVLILFSDGQETASDSRDTEREARFLKGGLDVEIFAIGIQASPTLLRKVATDEDHYFAAGNARFLYGIFERIAQRVTSTNLFRTLLVEDELPPDMALVPGSAEPAPEIQGRLLRWRLTDVPLNGLGLRYRLRPTTPGDRPTNVFARGTFEDGFGNPGSFDFPVPMVRVIVDTPTPTATPTSTSTPTATATATATATPVPTATPIPVPIYMPVALNERTCKPGERHADVMLVVDTSSSMVGAKIVAARAAARRFVTLLDLPRDQVGIVSFDSEARLVAPLSGDATSLAAAIDGLDTASGTRIDLGLQTAWEALGSGAAREGNTPTIVLLTDGRMPEPAEALRIAGEARAAGVRLYAIGLGAESDVDLPVLVRLAGDADRAFLAPRPEDLAGIYAQVAGEVPCPPDIYWGRRVKGR